MTRKQYSSLEWLAGQEAALVALLRDLVNIDSNSHDSASVVNVFQRLEQFFTEHGIQTAWHHHEGVANAISVQVPGKNPLLRPILLMGHCDTVFPTGEARKRPFHTENGRAYGPGVADMKAGVAMNAFILAAAAKAGGTEHPIIALFTNDEEIGSPASKHIIKHFAENAKAAFNAEPGRPGGEVVTKRKGGVFFELAVEGKAAHAGANFSDGASAILELAHKTIALDKMVDIAKGVTVNVGMISGGRSVNTIAPNARCGIDLRIETLEDRDQAVREIEDIAGRQTVAGTRASLKITGEFQPFVPTPDSEALFALYQNAAGQLGLRIEAQHSGGCSDAGITSSLGCPTLCATGPVGGNPHTREEYVELDSLVPRGQAVLLSIHELDALASASRKTTL